MPRPCAPNSGFSTSGASGSSRARDLLGGRQPFDGECRRRRQSGILEQERGHRLVDAAFDRLRGIPHRHAKPAQRMQHAETPGDRLERAGRNRAHEHGIRQRRRRSPESQARQALPVSKAIAASGTIVTTAPRRRSLAARPLERSSELSLTIEDARYHAADRPWTFAATHDPSATVYPRLRSSICRSRPPARNVSPLSIAVTITSAGLNSSGSMA